MRAWPLLLLALATSAWAGRTTVPEPGSLECEELDPCAAVLPGAVRFERPAGKPYAVGYDADGARMGWVVLSNDVVDIKAYSGKPLSTLVGLDPQGVITGGRVVHHSEPILLVGIPEKELHDFVSRYAGVRADEHVVVGRSDDDAVHVDGVSGATVTVLAQNQTILAAARALAQDVGVIPTTVAIPGHFVEDAPWSWARMVREGALAQLRVEAEEMGEEGDQPFLDLWFGIVDAPQLGIPLLGERMWRHAVDGLEPGEHLFVVFNRGTTSFKGSGFVRGGIFDRFRLEQGLRTQSFRDLDYTTLSRPPVEDAPAGIREAGLFVSRDHNVDPGEAYDLVFLASQYDTSKGAFNRDFRSFSATHRLPASVYALDGPSREQRMVAEAWRATRWKAAIVSGWLAMVVGLFVARRWLTASLKRLKLIHVLVMAGSFGILGLWLRAQPSVTQVLTAVGGVVGEWRWSLFLSEPLIFVSWIFILGVLLVWGRGVFCGWTCPYGALSELQYKLARRLRLPELIVPDRVHRRLRLARYAVLVGLVGVYLADSALGERMAEVEPFKSTFFVAPWTRHPLIFGWWLVLFLASFAVWRPFCQYLCPLGAALAVPSYLRLSGPRRRDFCTHCKICTRTCEPRAIDERGVINGTDCLNCMECEANYRDDQVCPPLVKARRDREGHAALGTVAALLVGLAASALTPGRAAAAEWVVGRDAPDVQAALDAARSGDTVVLPEGAWPGPVRVDRSIRLVSRGGSLVSSGSGHTLLLDGPGAILESLVIEGSGDDMTGENACVRTTPRATGAVIRDSHLTGCLFGIWVHTTEGVRIVGNYIEGRPGVRDADKGNGIHLFDATGLEVRDNVVVGARDGIYVSATERSVIADNDVSDQRYGIHYMYSYDNTVSGNVARRNNGGIALMGSQRLHVFGNEASDNRKVGILFRDVQYCDIHDNVAERNGEGLFFYSSLDNDIHHNRIQANRVGARVWAGTERNRLWGNAFLGNGQAIFYVSASDQTWGTEEDGGNYWSDHLAWDQDGDGFADRPYRADVTVATLLHAFPQSVLLLQSPALELIRAAQARLPALRVPSVLDPRPLTRPPAGLP